MIMNIVILTPKDMTNVNHGAAIRVYNLAKALAMLNNRVVVICVPYFRGGRFFREIREQNLTIIIASLLSIIFSLGFFLKTLIKASVVQIEFPIFSPLILVLRLLGKQVILDEHGVEIEFLKESRDALGKTVSFMEYFKIHLLELLGVKFSSYVFVCSNIDMKKIQFIYKLPKSKIAIVPNGVSKDFFEDVKAYRYGKPTVLFIGSFDHSPNLFAVKVLLEQVIPKLFEKNEEVVFAFVGRNPPSWLSQNPFGERIKIFGNVNDVRPFIAGADVVVVPIFHGSGTRIKILQCMALGKPVISTSKGAEGLEVEDGQNIIITDDLDVFVKKILWLLNDKSSAVKLGSNARKLVMEKYSWNQIAFDVLKFFNGLFK